MTGRHRATSRPNLAAIALVKLAKWFLIVDLLLVFLGLTTP